MLDLPPDTCQTPWFSTSS